MNARTHIQVPTTRSSKDYSTLSMLKTELVIFPKGVSTCLLPQIMALPSSHSSSPKLHYYLHQNDCADFSCYKLFLSFELRYYVHTVKFVKCSTIPGLVQGLVLSFLDSCSKFLAGFMPQVHPFLYCIHTNPLTTEM